MKLIPTRLRRRVPPSIHPYTQRVLNSGLFDAEWYLAKYPELAVFAAGPLAHFCEFGLHEHRDPGPNFDTRRYLSARPEAGSGPLPPFLRALDEGEIDDERPHWVPDDAESLVYLFRTSGLLNEAWYYEANPDVARSGKDALSHYLDYGAVELRDPGPGFDAEHYALTYPKYRVGFSSPIEHFLRLGLRRGYRPTGTSRYGRWLAAHDDLTSRDRARIAEEPVSAIVCCLFLLDQQNVVEIDELLRAMADQIGATWRACLLCGPDLDASSWKTVVAQVSADPRIACAETVEAALADLGEGDILLVGTGTCRLRPHACHAFGSALTHTQADAAYCDHDRIDRDGARHAPVFKPAMSPVFMRQVPYAGPIIALRFGPSTRDGLALVLNWRDEAERAFADLLLTLAPAQVIRIPLILYHQAVDKAVLPYRTNQPVPDPARTTRLWLDEQAGPRPTVQIIIPTRDRRVLLQTCIDSILADTDYPPDRYSIVIVDNGSTDIETLEYFAQMVSDPRVTVVASPGAFNFSKICNDGAALSDAEILIFLNNDMTVRQADWLKQLVALAARPEVGAVGAQLLYPDETVQHGGVVLGIDNIGAHALVDLPVATARALDTTREVSAVTGACLAIQRSCFNDLGGFDPLLRVDFNDVDICCRASQAGYRNLYVAEPLFYHHESLSRGKTVSRATRGRSIREANRVRQRHAPLILDDPFYNPNLSLTKVGRLAVPPRGIPRWRRPARGVRKVLLLGDYLQAWSDIGRSAAEQAAFLMSRGFEVVVGGSDPVQAVAGPGCQQVQLADAEEAALYATREGVDAILAHTAPFFSVTRRLGRRPLVYLFDHGDPPPGLFPARDERDDAVLEKRVCASLARRVFVTSPAVRDALFGQETVLLRHDRAPTAVWSEAWAERRRALREKFGYAERFIVLNLCRTNELEHRFNGFDDFVALAAEYPFTDPTLAGRALFLAADRDSIGYPTDHLPTDLATRGHVSDTELLELMAASDLYLTTQRWQGADCGITPALAMGLPVVASDIPAHRYYPVETALDVPNLCRVIAPHAERWRQGSGRRQAVILPGSDPCVVLADTIAHDLEQDSAEHWI